MVFSPIDVLLATSILQSLALAAFLLLPENIRVASNQLLVATLVSFAFGLGEILAYGTGLTMRHPGLAYVGTLVGLLQAGTLYLYAHRLRPAHAIHTTLFWVVAAILVVEYYRQPTAVQLRILQRQDYPGMLTSPVLAVAIHAVVLGYLLATIRALSRFGVRIRDVFSSIENRQLSWLRSLLIGYSGVWTVSLLYCLSAHVARNPASTRWIVGIGGAVGFAFINYLLLNALRQPSLFSGLNAEETALLEEFQADAPEATTGYQDAVLEARLRQHMRQARPHLHSNLTLAQLARELAVSPRELSRLLNQGFGTNFFEFISSHRLEEAKAMLADPTATGSILTVMYESGFNSKSVFNTLFRKSTGMTPSQYRTQHLPASPKP